MFLQKRQICLRTKWKDGWILSLCWKIYVKEYCWIIVVHPKCDRKTWATCLTQRCWLHELCSHFLLIYLCFSKTYTFHTEWSPFYASSRKKNTMNSTEQNLCWTVSESFNRNAFCLVFKKYFFFANFSLCCQYSNF